MARKLLLLLPLTALLAACGNSHQAEYAAAVQVCRDTFLKQAGTMVARVSCFVQQRERYGIREPSEALIRAIGISYATKVDSKQMSLADATLATERELNAVRQEAARTAAAQRAADAAESRANTDRQTLDALRQQQLEQALRPPPANYESPRRSTDCNIMMISGGIGHMTCD